MHDIYFDSAATTKPSKVAIEAAFAAANEYGNPSSSHFRGIAARKVIENARKQVTSALGCNEEELIFTGSGSESNNQAIIGIARARKKRSNVIISTDSEHPSVEQTLQYLEKEGFKVIRFSTKVGNIDIDELKESLKQKVALISVMRANNETGALYDIANIRREIDNSGCGAVFHCDAVQGFLKTLNRTELVKYCDLVSISAHKINALKGCGALFIKKGINLPAYILGGGQEHDLRSGTENTPAIAAFGAACDEWVSNRDRIGYITDLRDYAEVKISEALGDRIVIHKPAQRICCILSIELIGVKSEVVLNYLSGEGICVSAGSACSAHKRENRVLTAFGLAESEIDNTIRISFSYFNNREEVDLFVDVLKNATSLIGKI
ncbi:MAG: hypothetical protein A2Y15_00190 [Clostridiales bacterium GWF2_36_10]|nr:MAG: hypothetical protein A2Y15_00190 [Clostridiales bacterium GWF2_36_10]